jgi:hypothetical protein
MYYYVLGPMADTLDNIVFELEKLNINEDYPKEMPADLGHGRYLLAAVLPGNDFDDYRLILCLSIGAARKVFEDYSRMGCEIIWYTGKVPETEIKKVTKLAPHDFGARWS